MNKAALIFGAGKTGRGLCAWMCQESTWQYILVDNDLTLLAELADESINRAANDPNDADNIVINNAGTVTLLNEAQTQIPLQAKDLVHNSDQRLKKYALECDLWFSAVFGENLASLAQDLVPLIQQRKNATENILHILTCENLAHAAKVLQDACVEAAPELASYIHSHVHFVEGIVLKTCLYGENRQEILAQDLDFLPCDKDAFVTLPEIVALRPLENFQHQLQRKIYTYNAIACSAYSFSYG